MRVTTAQMFNSATYNINKTQQNYYDIQQTLLTQKRVNKPSDDPTGASQISEVKNSMNRLEQYGRNIDKAGSFIGATELALSEVIEELNKVLDTAIDINGGNATGTDYQVAAQQIESNFANIVQSANAKDGDRFVFSGYRTSTQAFDSNGDYQGGSGEYIEIEITGDNFLEINLCGDDVFKGPIDVFQAVSDLKAAVESGDQDQIKAMIPTVEAALDQIIAMRSGIGSKTVRMEAAEENNASLEEAYAQILSNLEDIDIAEATSEYAYQEEVYQATLMVSSKIFEQSILDFIT